MMPVWALKKACRVAGQVYLDMQRDESGCGGAQVGAHMRTVGPKPHPQHCWSKLLVAPHLPATCRAGNAPAGNAAAGGSYDRPWRQNMQGKQGAAGPGGKPGDKGSAGEKAKKQYSGPDQELAAMLERDIVDQGTSVKWVQAFVCGLLVRIHVMGM